MKKIKIDVVAVPLSGHLYPTMMLVAPLLDDPRYEIRLFTGPQKKEVAERLGFQVLPILENHIEEFEQVANNDGQLNILSAYRQLSRSLDLINIVSDQLVAEWTRNRPDVIIADFITLSAGLVAEELGIPWITTMATQFAIETTDGPPCFFGGMGRAKNSIQSFQQWLGRKATRLGKRCVVLGLHRRLQRYNFKLYNQKNQETIYSPYSILGMGMKELELKSGFPEHYLWIGPTATSVEAVEDYPFDMTPFKDKKKVLVTCGTQLPWAKENLILQTKKLAQIYPDYHFFVTLGAGADNFSREEVGDNISIISYLPYKQYVPQMDYIIHHGGAGIFYEAIRYNKPSLILPHDYDQFDYAVRGVEAGVARTAKRDDSQEIARNFASLVGQKDWSQLETIRQAAQNYDATAILKSEIERLTADQQTGEDK